MANKIVITIETPYNYLTEKFENLEDIPQELLEWMANLLVKRVFGFVRCKKGFVITGNTVTRRIGKGAKHGNR